MIEYGEGEEGAELVVGFCGLKVLQVAVALRPCGFGMGREKRKNSRKIQTLFAPDAKETKNSLAASVSVFSLSLLHLPLPLLLAEAG